MLTFTVGALGTAASLGIGNGAVFQLVPRYFPTQDIKERRLLEPNRERLLERVVEYR
jgi:nitrate/nitrite transporter NarK